MARAFAGASILTAAAFDRPALTVLNFGMRRTTVGVEAGVWNHSSNELGSSLRWEADGDLRFIRSHGISDGRWTVPAADIAALWPDPSAWGYWYVEHDGALNANDALVEFSPDGVTWTALPVVRTSSPSGSVSTSSSGQPRIGNLTGAALPALAELFRFGYHSAPLSDAERTAWITTGAVGPNALLAYALDASSPADDLSANGRDGTYSGSTLVADPTFSVAAAGPPRGSLGLLGVGR